ncbi:hypothetical protein BDR26DRAFT_1003859 [Obelidium mucronatum]|nr:hypothetical protein BDR26DRAFT_1003859 [Obelidium mucronatum]
MPAVFHVFQEFANDLYNQKFFYVDVRARFACRFIQCFLPIGLWIILIQQARDLSSFTAPFLNPLWGTEWALSIIGGPLASIVLYALHALPLEEPLPTTILLMVEFVCDTFLFILWLIETCVVSAVLHLNNLDCPYIWHPAPSNYYESGQEPAPIGNATIISIFIPNNATSSSSAIDWPITTSYTIPATTVSTTIPFKNTAIPTSTATAATALRSLASQQQQQQLYQSTHIQPAPPTTVTVAILQSHTCYPIMQNLSILNGIMTALFFLNICFDCYSYMKGVYWDYNEFNERNRAETMATIRKADRFGAAALGIGKSDYARSRKSSRVVAGSKPGSRNGSMVQRPLFGAGAAGGSIGGSYGSLNSLAELNRSSDGGKGLVAGKGALSGMANQSGSQLALDSNNSALKKAESFSNMKGVGYNPKVVDADSGPGLSVLKDSFRLGAASKGSTTPNTKRSRAGSVTSLLKRSGNRL